MPHATARDGVKLYYEAAGSGMPLVFIHEFAGDYRSWEPQMRFFARYFRCIAFNARGFPPSDVPEDPARYSQAHACDDVIAVLGPAGARVQDQDPGRGAGFARRLLEQSPKGQALTVRGVQMRRPSLWELVDAMKRLDVPTLSVTGDEDEPCLEPALLMTRSIAT